MVKRKRPESKKPVEKPIEKPVEKPMTASGVEVQIVPVVKKEEPAWVAATVEEVQAAEKAGTLVGYDPAKGLAKFK